MESNPMLWLQSLRKLHEEALAEQYRPVPTGPETHRLYDLCAQRPPARRMLIEQSRDRERDRIVRWLVHDSGVELILPSFLQNLQPFLKPEAQRNPRRITQLLLGAAQEFATNTVDGAIDIGEDARANVGPRLRALIAVHRLEGIDSLAEYLAFRRMYPPHASYGQMARMGELHSLALEDLRAHQLSVGTRPAALLYRLVCLTDHALFQERHPILDNP